MSGRLGEREVLQAHVVALAQTTKNNRYIQTRRRRLLQRRQQSVGVEDKPLKSCIPIGPIRPMTSQRGRSKSITIPSNGQTRLPNLITSTNYRL